MNTYPAWWDKTVTVYNKYEDESTGEVSWFKTQIAGAFVKNTGERVVLGDIALDTNTVVCRIRKDDNFVEKYVWDALSAHGAKFTLAPGDIIVFAAASENIDEYATGQHSTDLLNKYKRGQGAMVIEAVNINVGPGRGVEHYHVKGT